MTKRCAKPVTDDGMSANDVPTKELRIGLVLYGGVSLAIYINGVITEIWNALRASRGHVFPDEDGCSGGKTDAVYQKLLRKLERHEGARSIEIVVDTIAGTSAGGINAGALAKGVVDGGDMRTLSTMWIDKADIKNLKADAPRRLGIVWRSLLRVLSCAIDELGEIRHRIRRLRGVNFPWVLDQLYSMLTSEDGTETPLRGRYFTKMVACALAGMESSDRRLIGEHQQLDLFLTRTDFHGWPRHVPVSRPFHRRPLYEPKHAHVMRFEAKHGETLGDDLALTYAMRTTAGFPVAFAPVNPSGIAEGLADGTGTAIGVAHRHLREHELAGPGFDPDRAWMVDGGILDNKPFGHVAGAIERKPAAREVYRMVVYVEPDPVTQVEVPPEKPPPTRDVPKGLFRLFRHEPIYEDLRQLHERNSKVARIREISRAAHEGALRAAASLAGPALAWPPAAASLDCWRRATNDALCRRDDPAYAGYVALKARRSAGVLARVVCRALDFPEHSRHAWFVRDLIRTWVDGREWTCPPKWYESAHTGGRYVLGDGQLKLLDAFDLPFRQRRLRALVQAVNGEYASETCCSEKRRRWHVDAFKRRLAEAAACLDQIENDGHADILDEVKALLAVDDTSAVDRVIGCLQDACDRAEFVTRHDGALLTVYRRIACRFSSGCEVVNDKIVEAIKNVEDCEIQRRIAKVYVAFPFVDRVVFPLMDSVGVEDLIDVGVMRMSPDDTELLKDFRDPLHGDELYAFAGFLNKSARENDLLWGRLNGAERLVDLIARAAVSDDAGFERLADLRREFKIKAMKTILDDEGERDGNSTGDLRNSIRTRLDSV